MKPEQRRQLAKLLGTDDGKPAKAKPKHALPETLRRDLAAYRLQAAQVEIANHPDIALDLLAFRAAAELLDKRSYRDGADVQFNVCRPKADDAKESSAAAKAFAALEKSFPTDWRKAKSEAARFEAFRSLPQAEKLKLLAYCLALTLQPKLAPAAGEEATAYDVALSLTKGNVAAYWRPAKDSFLSRITRDQLLSIGRETLGDAWAQSRAGEKKASLVDQLSRAFANPDKSGRTAQQIEKLKSWLPAGMAFDAVPASKPAKAKKARKAA